MSRAKRSDLATTADWSFTGRADLMAALEGQARNRAAQYGLDADDVFQETLLWLAVRPEIQAGETWAILMSTRTPSVNAMSKQQTQWAHEVPLDYEGSGNVHD